jgi:hypothetical protein
VSDFSKSIYREGVRDTWDILLALLAAAGKEGMSLQEFEELARITHERLVKPSGVGWRSVPGFSCASTWRRLSPSSGGSRGRRAPASAPRGSWLRSPSGGCDVTARQSPRHVPRTTPREKLAKARQLHVQAISLIDEALSELETAPANDGQTTGVAVDAPRPVSEVARRRAADKLRRLGVTI